MEIIAMVLISAVLVEAIVEVFKGFVKTDFLPAYLWPAVAAIVGVLFCVLGKIDLIVLLGINFTVPIVGSVLTGLLISRGSSFVHDLWKRIKG